MDSKNKKRNRKGTPTHEKKKGENREINEKEAGFFKGG